MRPLTGWCSVEEGPAKGPSRLVRDRVAIRRDLVANGYGEEDDWCGPYCECSDAWDWDEDIYDFIRPLRPLTVCLVEAI